MPTYPMTIAVNLAAETAQPRNYEIAIAPDSLHQVGDRLVSLGLGKKSRQVLVVSHPVIFKHYGDRLMRSLEAAGFAPQPVLLPAGERYKTANSLQKIYDAALAHRLERSSLLVALGGGVVGDMTGFAAATWLRGIHFVQVPTSLLAMVDAAIGGKTGLNHPQGKNLIGAFYQPRQVWIDPTVLHTLPVREFRAGMAEVIKYGVIWDRELFAQLEATPQLARVRDLTTELLATILYRCAQAKADIVSQDEKESGLRAILNYGHTIGHAIEAVTNYRLFNHGEAVGLGMLAVGAIAAAMGLWTQAEQERQLELLVKTKLPLHLPAHLDADEILTAMTKDKKVSSGKVQFILPTAIGTVMQSDAVDPALVKAAIGQLQRDS